MVEAQFGGVTRIHKIFFYGELEITVLRQQPWNHIAVNIREAEVASCVAVGQAFVVEAQIWWRYPHPQNLPLRWTGN